MLFFSSFFLIVIFRDATFPALARIPLFALLKKMFRLLLSHRTFFGTPLAYVKPLGLTGLVLQSTEVLEYWILFVYNASLEHIEKSGYI